ncbi:hypothetical protein OSK09_27635, partial [Escherichia coli]|nr:hypothetical protein [Escherichia coli]
VSASSNHENHQNLSEKKEKRPGKKDSIVKMRLMETTDIHTNLLNYDYYKDAPYEKVGLVKTASLVKQARSEVKNSLL